MFFRRILISLFVSFSVLMLFILIIRIGNGKTGFFGFSDLINYLDSGNVDMYKPLRFFNDDIGGIVRNFASYINGVVVHNPLDALLVVIKGLAQIFKLLSIPIVAIFDFIKMIVEYLQIFGNFVNYIISFEGYVSSV